MRARVRLRALARRFAFLTIGGVVALASCAGESSEDAPRVAPPSRHAALRDELLAQARTYAFADGDWQEDLGDAPFFGVASLARRKGLDAEDTAKRDAALERARRLFKEDLLSGDLQDKVMAAFVMIEHLAARAPGDRSADDVAALDALVDRLDSLTRTLGDYLEAGADRSWAIRTYGPTAVTALVALVEAQYALYVGGPRKGERLERALAIDAKIRERALADVVEAYTGKGVRAYAIAPGKAALEIYPNVAMLLLKARLFLLTKDEAFRLEARALYGALQALKLSDAPARYSSTYAAPSIGVDTRDLSTLSSQNYLALALLSLFEITGETRFVDEADRVIDGIASMKGPWCQSHVRDKAECTPACVDGQACISKTCAADRCTTGLLHHVVNGRLAEPKDGTVFCAGCNLQTLYVLGYRRTLANEPF
jgi:hypothetical protein